MKRALALFDFDGTMCAGDSIVPYVRLARKKRLMTGAQFHRAWFAGLQFLLGLKASDAMKTIALSFLKDISADERARFDRSFAYDYLMPRVSEAARERLNAHREQGDCTLLVSASTENYMRYVREALACNALLATPISEQGVVSGNCHGEEKVRRIKEYLAKNGIEADLPASSAYGDSAGDLPMLRLVGHGYRVNPGKKLSRLAPDLPALTWR